MAIATAKPTTLEAFLDLPETKPASEFLNGKIIKKTMPQGELGLTTEEIFSWLSF